MLVRRAMVAGNDNKAMAGAGSTVSRRRDTFEHGTRFSQCDTSNVPGANCYQQQGPPYRN